eukprot:gene11322-11472_t
MVFEAPAAGLFMHAAATVLQAPPKVVHHLPPHLMSEQDPLLRELAPLHISRDHLYTTSERQGGRVTGTGKHSQLALGMTCLPTFPKDAYTAYWHRPRHWWNARMLLLALLKRYSESGAQVADQGKKQYRFEAVGLTLRRFNVSTDAGNTDLSEVWQVVSSSRAFKEAASGEVPQVLGCGPRYNPFGGRLGDWLHMDSSLNSQGCIVGLNFLVPVWSAVAPLKTAAVGGLLPPDVPCSSAAVSAPAGSMPVVVVVVVVVRLDHMVHMMHASPMASPLIDRPPAAFKTIRSLSATSQGHVLLLEYLEERPLLLLQPGMGMRLTTYYRRVGSCSEMPDVLGAAGLECRRKNDSDTHYQGLQAEYSEGLLAKQALPLTSADRYDARPPWMVGTPQLLTPDDVSPFYELAPIPPGEMVFAVDTPCFRAPAVPHVCSAADFLLVRLPAGQLSLRELTGCVSVGQQHPSTTIWPPMSAEALAYERARFKAHVLRQLRLRAERPNVKAGKAVAAVSLTELMVTFSGMSIGNRDSLARLLKEDCMCAPLPENLDQWSFVPGAKVTPDNAVQYEALIAGIGQRQVWGVAADEVSRALELVGGPPAVVLRLVLDMLLPDEAGRQAAAAIEQCVINPPWAQSAAYHAALRESKNPTALLLMGGGDPTGRGRGFAFTREDLKKGKDDAGTGPGVRAKDDGTITGTDADLRRLGHRRAGELLLTKFNMPEETVAQLARWDRIDAIR